MGIDFRAEVLLEDDDLYPNDWRVIANFDLGNLRCLRDILTPEEINDYSGVKMVPAEAAIDWLEDEPDKPVTIFMAGAREFIRMAEMAGYRIQVRIIWC